MKPEKAPTFLLGSLICSIFGHRFTVSKVITKHIKEYQCRCCGHEVTDTANGQLASLTPKFRETNSFLAKFHARRSRRMYSRAS